MIGPKQEKCVNHMCVSGLDHGQTCAVCGGTGEMPEDDDHGAKPHAERCNSISAYGKRCHKDTGHGGPHTVSGKGGIVAAAWGDSLPDSEPTTEERFLDLLDKYMGRHAKPVDPGIVERMRDLVKDVDVGDMTDPLPDDEHLCDVRWSSYTTCSKGCIMDVDRDDGDTTTGDIWVTIREAADSVRNVPALETINVGDAWLDKHSDISLTAGAPPDGKVDDARRKRRAETLELIASLPDPGPVLAVPAFSAQPPSPEAMQAARRMFDERTMHDMCGADEDVEYTARALDAFAEVPKVLAYNQGLADARKDATAELATAHANMREHCAKMIKVEREACARMIETYGEHSDAARLFAYMIRIGSSK